MIQLVRVDYRLLHGQVAVSWTADLGIDCILLVSDTLLDDPIRVTSVKLAKPTGVKVVAKNIEDSIKAIKSGVTDKYKLLVVCETIEGAVHLLKETGVKSLRYKAWREQKRNCTDYFCYKRGGDFTRRIERIRCRNFRTDDT